MIISKLGRHEAYLRLYDIITRTKIIKDKPDEYLRLERKLSAELIKNWRKDYTQALQEVFKLIPKDLTDDARQIILDGLSNALGSAFGYSPAVRNEMRKYITEAYEKCKGEFVVKPSLTLPDKRAVEVLTKHNCYWLGQHYGKHISSKIAETTQQAILDGVGRDELAHELRKELGGENSNYQYWDVVASSALVRSRAFGAISGMEEAGIIEYEILAMGDERMCSICAEMDGRTFSVEVARRKINEALGVEDPDEFKELFAWQTKPATGISNSELEEHGQSLPPFHGRCRCVVISSILE